MSAAISAAVTVMLQRTHSSSYGSRQERGSTGYRDPESLLEAREVSDFARALNNFLDGHKNLGAGLHTFRVPENASNTASHGSYILNDDGTLSFRQDSNNGASNLAIDYSPVEQTIRLTFRGKMGDMPVGFESNFKRQGEGYAEKWEDQGYYSLRSGAVHRALEFMHSANDALDKLTQAE